MKEQHHDISSHHFRGAGRALSSDEIDQISGAVPKAPGVIIDLILVKFELFALPNGGGMGCTLDDNGNKDSCTIW